jgi:pyridoxal phosphate enzyme (YggS family)
MGAVAENLRRLVGTIGAAAVRAGQNPDEITLVAVSKTMPVGTIREAREAGQIDFGENRVQEAKRKIPEFSGWIRWHLVGHLQTNKARDAVALFNLIQSVDSIKVAEEIDRQAARIGKIQDVLVQVNTTGESKKSGCRIEETEELCGRVARLDAVRLQGLMTIGPFVDDREPIRRAFRSLRTMYDRLGGTEWGRGRMKYLSMGMTDDFEIALDEGANMLRIGTAIFGPRPRQ